MLTQVSKLTTAVSKAVTPSRQPALTAPSGVPASCLGVTSQTSPQQVVQKPVSVTSSPSVSQSSVTTQAYSTATLLPRVATTSARKVSTTSSPVVNGGMATGSASKITPSPVQKVRLFSGKW